MKSLYLCIVKKKILENIEVIDAGAKGKAIAKYNNKAIMIRYVVPGDILNLRVTKKRKKYLEAVPVDFIKFSDKRTTPFCSHFGTCGGCKWQMMQYEWQLHYKEKQVVDSLKRIAKVELPEISKILPSEETRFYRNKLEYTFSNKRWLTEEEIDSGKTFEDKNALGFHIPGRFDKILQIEKCHLQDDKSNEIRNFIHQFSEENKLSYFDIREQHGLLRNLIIRNSNKNEWMIIVVFYQDKKKERVALLDAIYDKFAPTSLCYIINEKKNDSIADQEPVLYKGKTYITEQMEDLQFRIGPKSFFQTNSKQAYRLYQFVRSFAELSGKENVYDLYTGTGTIANFIAKEAKKVLGIEYISEAVDDAIKNSKINKVKNTTFLSGDIKDLLNDQLFEKYGFPDVIITDPPRPGMHKDVTMKILEANPLKIIYVSCNPATQARDIQLLNEKYAVKKVQPVDMFPHTEHVENIILLERRP